MGTNLSPIPPPTHEVVSESGGIVTRAWEGFFQFLHRYTKPRWRDTNVGGVSLTKAAANQPDLVTLDGTNIITYAFDGATKTEEAHGAFELQHDYQEGTDIYPHVHWYPSNTGTGNVEWFLDYLIKEGTTPIRLTGTMSIVSAASGTAFTPTFAEFGAITGTTLKIGSQIHFRLYLVPTGTHDTYASDALLGTFGIHYRIDAPGSISKASK